MQKRTLLTLLIACGALSGTTMAGAAQPDLLDPAPVKLGGVDLVPQLELQEIYDDNFYSQVNSREFWVQILTLQLDALAPVGPHEYSAHYKAEAGVVENSSVDNYVDQSFHLRGFWDPDPRHRFELKGGYRQEHERRGTENFQGDKAFSIDETPMYEETSALGRYTYGADKSRGRLVLEAKGAEEPPTGRGDYVDVTEWGIDWRHEWSDRIASRIRYLQIDEIYKGDPEGREDTSILYGFDVDYAMRRWLVFGLFFTQDDHQSNLEEFDYPHSVAGLTVRASL